MFLHLLWTLTAFEFQFMRKHQIWVLVYSESEHVHTDVKLRGDTRTVFTKVWICSSYDLTETTRYMKCLCPACIFVVAASDIWVVNTVKFNLLWLHCALVLLYCHQVCEQHALKQQRCVTECEGLYELHVFVSAAQKEKKRKHSWDPAAGPL